MVCGLPVYIRLYHTFKHGVTNNTLTIELSNSRFSFKIVLSEWNCKLDCNIIEKSMSSFDIMEQPFIH